MGGMVGGMDGYGGVWGRAWGGYIGGWGRTGNVMGHMRVWVHGGYEKCDGYGEYGQAYRSLCLPKPGKKSTMFSPTLPPPG
jgi:hypothetical protein